MEVDPSDQLLAALRITRAQYAELLKFESVVRDVLKANQDAFFLVRWMRARNFDLKKAENMLRKNVEWRKRWDADNILYNWQCPPVLKDYDIGGSCGYDKEGSPIWIYINANMDTKGLYYSVNRRDIIKKYIHKMESFHVDIKIQSEKLGRRIDNAVIIVDLEGFTVQHLFATGMDIILKIFQMIESNYPEDLKQCYVINGPAIFPLVYRVIKPFMNEETRKRIKILGSDYRRILLEIIDADELPVHWGGNKVDPQFGDEYCSTLVRCGGIVPKSFYLKPDDLVDKSLVVKLRVPNLRCSEVNYKVTEPNAMLRYTFWTSSYDIKFSIDRLEPNTGEPTAVLSPVKYNCADVPEDGTIQCQEPAEYVIRFDNTYSWLHSKDVSYVIQTVAQPPELSEPMTPCVTSNSLQTMTAPDLTGVLMKQGFTSGS